MDIALAPGFRAGSVDRSLAGPPSLLVSEIIAKVISAERYEWTLNSDGKLKGILFSTQKVPALSNYEDPALVTGKQVEATGLGESVASIMML